MRIDARLSLPLLAAVAFGCSAGSEPEQPAGLALSFAVVEPQAVSQAEADALADAFDRVDRYEVQIVVDATDEPVASASVTVGAGLAVHVLDVTVPEDALGKRVRISLVAYDGALELYRSVAVTTLSSSATTTSVELEIRYSGPGIRGVVVDAQGTGLAGVSVSLNAGQSVLDAAQTEPDGSYLFVDVAPGAYQVAVAAPGQLPFVCPPARDVAVSAADESIVANFLATTAACDNSVLVVSGGDVDDTPNVGELLLGGTGLTVSTFFFTNQTPSLALLRQHDVVVLFTNGLFDESPALGSRIAQYVSEGGNLVVASFYWQNRSDSGLDSPGWGPLESIDPLDSSGGAVYQQGALDPQTVVAHPLTAQVQTVTSTGYWGGATAKAGTQVVASWAGGGGPFIAYRVLAGGQRIVAVTLFPASGASATGDWQQVFRNAASWAGAAGGPSP